MVDLSPLGPSQAGKGGEAPKKAKPPKISLIGPMVISLGETGNYEIVTDAKNASFKWEIQGPKGTTVHTTRTIKFAQAEPGEYLLTATVTDQNGASTQASIKVMVAPKAEKK